MIKDREGKNSVLFFFMLQKKECETLTCTVDKKRFYKGKAMIGRRDPRAIVIVFPTKEVFGEGFQEERQAEAVRSNRSAMHFLPLHRG